MVVNKLLKEIENNNVSAFYNSWTWRKKSKEILKRDNYECQICKSKGRFHKAECVHHKKHIKEYSYLALTNDNLISLCNSCHNKEHPEKLIRRVKKKYITEEKW